MIQEEQTARQLLILGASGHGKVVADIARQIGYTDILFLDDDPDKKVCEGYKVAGKCTDFTSYDADICIAIGNPEIRAKLFAEVKESRYNLPFLIHPSAVLSANVSIGEGTVVMAGAVINIDAIIGRGCIVNTGATVDHDCRIGDFVHIAVGAHLAGSVTVGKGTWIGIGAVVSNNITICEGCTIGAGAVVVDNICVRGTYIGVPAKRMIEI